MRKSKFFFTVAATALLLSSSAFLSAQVTVGSDKTPEKFSLLELVSGNNKGLRLPQMTTEQRNTMAETFNGSTEAWGLQIFNTTTHCVNTWNGTVWIEQCFDASPSTDCVAPPNQPSIISGNAVVVKGATSLIYSVDYVSGVTYDWQLPAGWTQTDGGTTNSITVTASSTSTLGQTVPITVTPNNSCGNGTARTLNVSVGCGAYVNSATDWREFMCWNLGADQSANPFIPSQALHGNKYKWGTGLVALSAADDQNPDNDAGFGINWETAAYGGIPPTANTGISWDMITANPCPAGYRVPTNVELKGVATNNAISRTIGTWVSGDYTTGIYFGNSLFFPAAGIRNYTYGTWDSARGFSGNYWCSTSSPASTMAHAIQFTQDTNPIQIPGYRTSGMSVRCIAE